MDTFPQFPMFALLKDSYVIDAVLGGPDTYVSAIDPKVTYNITSGEYTVVLVTIQNSPIKIGDYFNNNVFIDKEEKKCPILQN